MALSDACFEFMQATAQAADELAASVHHYAAPDYPILYGIEIEALRRTCAAIRKSPFDPELGAKLLRLAASVMTYHDTVPGTAVSSAREIEMGKLVRLLQANLDHEEAVTVQAIIENVVVETGFTQQAAERLKAMLPKLGKSAYDIAIKIISDIGSAAVKKILGL
jgi:Uncharacterized protein conserved in bacteria (DUF2321)